MEGNFFHILNRGVEKRKIFLTKDDYLRFTHNLLGLNSKDRVFSYFHRLNSSNYGLRKAVVKIVDVLCWCLMPNHPHVFVQEKIERGASLFSQKLTTGYTQYFNLTNDREGVLFQGKSKIILIRRDAHFLHMPYYIFSNPIELIEPKWKAKGIKNLKKVIAFLENYKYSSFPDIIGKNNFPEIINKKLFYELYETNENRFKRDFIEWLKSFEDSFGDFED